jgi:hypothetical protein
MRKLAIATLFGFVLPLAMAPLSHAQTPPDSSAVPSRPVQSTANTGPITLVSLAYQGFLEGQGIPSANGLTDGYTSGQITAESLVQAGVSAGRIPSGAVADANYIRDVDGYLQDISREQGSSQ